MTPNAEVELALIPVRALSSLRDGMEAGDARSRAAFRTIEQWIYRAQQALADDDDPEIGCLGCAQTLVEQLIAGYVVMLTKDYRNGFCAAVCADCMATESVEDLQRRLGREAANHGWLVRN